MESLPQRPTQRRQSPVQGSEEQSQQDATNQSNNSQPPSTRSTGSSPLLLNEQSVSEFDTSDFPLNQSSATTRPDEPSEPRKCWICFSDETEDPPQSSAWRTPCTCALTAHESCILDWVADMEAPDQSRSVGSTKDIRCPQCKSEIHLSRPRSVVVDAVGVFEKIQGKLFLPLVLMGFGSSLMIVFSHHGAHTVKMIFGPEDAGVILAPRRPGENQLIQYVYDRFPNLAQWYLKDLRSWRVALGLPLIPLTLIASRTTLADSILPILPMAILATQPQVYEMLNQKPGQVIDSTKHMKWPPSASLAFVMLPYIRGLYGEMMERVWGERERGWLKEVQPQLSQGENGEEQQRNNPANQQNDEEVIELELGIDIPGFGGNRDDQADQADQAPAPAPQIPTDQAPDLNAPPADGPGQDGHHPVDDFNGVHAPQGAAAQQEQPQEQRQQQQGQQPQQNDNIVITGTKIAHTMIGALLFPTISAAMGEVLQMVMPKSWTNPPALPSVMARSGYRISPNGLLQTRWGRSLVGGCLFVVVKDAVRIYCRWRMAQAFRQRRVMNWDKNQKKPVL
ncbi:MAG: hypothetical protein M1831_005677 [Alyxoria varia]|nr:MAG: hypothetical protein M1831_005677 [Alyxoria varia]